MAAHTWYEITVYDRDGSVIDGSSRSFREAAARSVKNLSMLHPHAPRIIVKWHYFGRQRQRMAYRVLHKLGVERREAAQ